MALVPGNALGVSQSESSWWEQACLETEDPRDVISGLKDHNPTSACLLRGDLRPGTSSRTAEGEEQGT
jgi:hypothetical protein